MGLVHRRLGRGRVAWHEGRAPGVYVLSRGWPVRFDLLVRVEMPGGLRLSRLARQIRQDMWRALRGLRGFSPAVRLREEGGVIAVEAGGALFGGRSGACDCACDRARAEAVLREVLEAPARRLRWASWARAAVLAFALPVASGLPLAGGAEAGALGPDVEGVPSGQDMALFDLFIEEQAGGARWARFRFLAPGLGKGVEFAAVEADFPHLCASYALPLLDRAGEKVSQVVISLSSDEVEFGVSDPDVIQFFEAFRVEGGACIWEGF